ncbi:response regulator transcription factor [Nitrospirillum iridis]|uniref:Two-component system OmpR family response regulator n=1 Tax=Nitrospirillum iridis TaxID=765888 RepID=A0A7X0EHE8_9PROT|nr:response regulator transcription factor [Nitrospirillum iridis]MBB6255076.1 two-component system OmpR family response regulator [Nitrospirillum iridis]
MPTLDPIAHIHLVEDEPEMAGEIITSLEAQGYAVSHSAAAAAALDFLRAERGVAVVVADRLLPGGMDGLEMVEVLRDEGIATPILVLSALGSVDDRVRGLNAGGDDYLTKPFAVTELVARIEALRRRPPDTRATTLRVGSLEMDLLSRTVRRGEREVPLLPREFKLLEYMMRRPDQVITPAMLLTDVWHYRFVPQTNVVDVHMGKLRHKIDEVGDLPMIHRVRGAGFMLRAAD